MSVWMEVWQSTTSNIVSPAVLPLTWQPTCEHTPRLAPRPQAQPCCSQTQRAWLSLGRRLCTQSSSEKTVGVQLQLIPGAKRC
jgi:hypothetical protein